MKKPNTNSPYHFPFHNPCPVCHSSLDAADAVEGEGNTPSEGDFSICVYCGTPLRFKKDLTYELIPQEVLDSPELPEALKKLIQLFNKPDRGMKISLGWRKGYIRGKH